MKTVMSVGQCNPDHYALSGFLQKNFLCEVVRIDSTEEALEKLKSSKIDLVLVNRKLDIDYTDGLELIIKMKHDEKLSNIPIMLVSNYMEYQKEAIEHGAIMGIGKSEYGELGVISRFHGILDPQPS